MVVAFQQEAQSASLGNSANISARGENTVKRFALLDHAKLLLGAADLRNSKGKEKGKRPHRTRLCHAFRAYGSDSIVLRLNQNANESRAAFTGLQTCGSIHACPVCAQREAAKKGEFILKSLAWSKRTNHKDLMLTLTARHNRHMSLAELETAFKAAWDTFNSHRAWKKLKKELGIKHWIANVEAPHGENGWHYHKHIILFATFDKLKEEKAQADINQLWIQCLAIHGLEALPEYATKITTGSAVGNEYLTKCGIVVTENNGRLEYELTGTENKDSKNHWELLEMSYYGNAHAGNLYLEYAEHMTGKNFLTTSHGLADLVEAEELPVSTEEEADQMTDFAEISPYWWDIVRGARGMSDVLKVAAKSRNVNAIRELLWELQERLILVGELEAYHRKFRFIPATSDDFVEGIRRIQP